MGKTELLRNNFGIWNFNERHNKHICVPADAGKVNWKYFNIVDLCGILPYKRMCPDLCGRIIYNCISSPFLYYNQYAWVQISFVMIS